MNSVFRLLPLPLLLLLLLLLPLLLPLLLLLLLPLLLPLTNGQNQHQPTIVSFGRSMTGSFTAANSKTLARVAQA